MEIWTFCSEAFTLIFIYLLLPVLVMVGILYFPLLFKKIKSFFYGLYYTWNSSFQIIDIRWVPINGSLVNPIKKNNWQYLSCPAGAFVSRNINNTIEIEFPNITEKCVWYCFPGVNFYVTKSDGRIKRIVFNHGYVRNRGEYFRSNYDETVWPKYYTSVVLAYIEVLKFTQRHVSYQPGIVSNILKYYGENFFVNI